MKGSEATGRTNNVTFHQFSKFWSTERIFGMRRAETLRDASFRIAINYLHMGKMKEARALMLNGAFAVEYMVSTVMRRAEVLLFFGSVLSWCASLVYLCLSLIQYWCMIFSAQEL